MMEESTFDELSDQEFADYLYQIIKALPEYRYCGVHCTLEGLATGLTKPEKVKDKPTCEYFKLGYEAACEY